MPDIEVLNAELGMQDKIFNVLVPTEKVIKVKNGKRAEVDEKFYPGYVLVDMIVTDDSWYVVRNTPRVTGFVGAGTTPVPMSQQEIDAIMNRMSKDETKHNIQVAVGDLVNYMQWMAEPAQNTRIRVGVWVLLFLAMAVVFVWRLNAAYWKEVK